MRRTAVLAGYYGFGNTGDEAILTAILAGLRRRAPETAFAVVSGDPESTARRHDVEAIPWRDVAALSQRIGESDLVLVGGGGLFQDYWGLDTSTLLTPRHGEIAFYTAPAVLAALAKKPVVLYGLGVGPLRSPEARRYVLAAADTAVHLSVRDEASRDLLVEIGVPGPRVRLSADPAFALEPAAKTPGPGDLCRQLGVEPRGAVVALALRPWSIGVEPAAWEAQVVAALDRFLEREKATLLFVPLEKSPWTDKDDFELSARLAASLSHSGRAAVLTEPLSPVATAQILGSCDLVLGMRLHSLVFAASGGVPCVGLAYDPKVSSLLARLGVSPMGIGLTELTAEALSAKLQSALGGAPDLSRKLTESARGLRALAEEDLDRAGRILADPPAAPPLTERVMSLFDDALQANFEEARGIRARLSESEGRLESLERAHARERALLEQRLGETRQELARLQTSTLWRAANLYWRARRTIAGAVRRLLGRPASDWAGADDATAAARNAPPMPEDNRYDVVWLARGAWDALADRPRSILERYAAAGHRVFFVPPGTGGGRVTRAERLVELALPDDDAAAALAGLARAESFGATAVFVEDADRRLLARRMRADRNWLFVDASGERDASPEPPDLVLDPAASPEDVLHAVPQFFPKASIVVITHGNRDVSRLCLESLRARTEWPNFEVIAVDNASTDGTAALLEETARAWPALRVLANAENRGFAAAINQGFDAATGEILVMLNNDTVVTRGWLTALARHLRANPKLGLVGPATNAISNEARVPVGYRGLADLPPWAAGFAREHDGETFAIPMLAFFCTALRRETRDAVGPLDERFGTGMFEDDDYCRRAREQGWEVRCARDAFVHHWQKASFRRLGKKAYMALYEENRRKYEEKWGGSRAGAAPVRADPGRHAPALGNLLARSSSHGTVVFLPSVGWGIHLFQRPHHLARAFARAGWTAIFDCSNAQDRVDGFKEIEPNLYLYRGPAGVLAGIPDPLLWSFPYNYDQVEAFGTGARVVYDWIDDLSVFPYDRVLLEKNHDRALSEATVVAAVARRLHTEALQRRSDALYLPNGVEFERFAGTPPPVSDRDVEPLLAAGRPIAGYYGALAEWFDYELLDAAARLRPDWSFLLIGPMYDQSLQGRPMLKRENVRWIGPRDYHLLPGYLALFDVATIPFRINPITTATSPLKLYEYFAGAKPVVTTPMPECAAYPEVAIAADAEAFAAALDPARERGRDPRFRERLVALGRENSWQARVTAALAALEAARAPARER